VSKFERRWWITRGIFAIGGVIQRVLRWLRKDND